MPEERIVVVNTTPIIGLSLLNKLSLLRDLYIKVHIPPTVYAEVMAGGQDKSSIKLDDSPWIVTTPLADPRQANLFVDLDRGEAEVIALAKEMNADLVVIDKRLARWYARRVGLTLTGTLGILIKAKNSHLVGAVAPLILQLQTAGIWLHPTLVAEVLQLAGEG